MSPPLEGTVLDDAAADDDGRCDGWDDIRRRQAVVPFQCLKHVSGLHYVGSMATALMDQCPWRPKRSCNQLWIGDQEPRRRGYADDPLHGRFEARLAHQMLAACTWFTLQLDELVEFKAQGRKNSV